MFKNLRNRVVNSAHQVKESTTSFYKRVFAYSWARYALYLAASFAVGMGSAWLFGVVADVGLLETLIYVPFLSLITSLFFFNKHHTWASWFRSYALLTTLLAVIYLSPPLLFVVLSALPYGGLLFGTFAAITAFEAGMLIYNHMEIFNNPRVKQVLSVSALGIGLLTGGLSLLALVFGSGIIAPAAFYLMCGSVLLVNLPFAIIELTLNPAPYRDELPSTIVLKNENSYRFIKHKIGFWQSMLNVLSGTKNEEEVYSRVKTPQYQQGTSSYDNSVQVPQGYYNTSSAMYRAPVVGYSGNESERAGSPDPSSNDSGVYKVL